MRPWSCRQAHLLGPAPDFLEQDGHTGSRSAANGRAQPGEAAGSPAEQACASRALCFPATIHIQTPGDKSRPWTELRAWRGALPVGGLASGARAETRALGHPQPWRGFLLSHIWSAQQRHFSGGWHLQGRRGRPSPQGHCLAPARPPVDPLSASWFSGTGNPPSCIQQLHQGMKAWWLRLQSSLRLVWVTPPGLRPAQAPFAHPPQAPGEDGRQSFCRGLGRLDGHRVTLCAGLA